MSLQRSVDLWTLFWPGFKNNISKRVLGRHNQNYDCKVTRWNDFACKHKPSCWLFLGTVMVSQAQIINFFPLLKQIAQIEPTVRLESSNQDRLTALQAVTNFGAPAEVFDSEGECLRPQIAGKCPTQAVRLAAMSTLINLMLTIEKPWPAGFRD